MDCPRFTGNVSIIKIVLLCYIILAGCTKAYNRQSDPLRAGGIELQNYSVNFDKRTLEMGIFRLCSTPTLFNCATAVYISEDGYFLTSNHSAIPQYTSEPNQEELDITTVEEYETPLYLVSSQIKHNGRYFTPDIFKARVVATTKSYLLDQDEDISILKVDSQNLDTLRNKYLPLVLTKATPERGERIYAAGFADHWYRPEGVKKMLEGYSTFYEQAYGRRPDTDKLFETFIYPEGNLYITTGLFAYSESADLSSWWPLLEDDKFSENFRLYDSRVQKDLLEYYQGSNLRYSNMMLPALDIIAGMSGSPWINKNGEVFGISTTSSGASERSKGAEENDNPYASSGTSTKWILSKFDLSTILMPGKLYSDKEIADRYKTFQMDNASKVAKVNNHVKSTLAALPRKKMAFKSYSKPVDKLIESHDGAWLRKRIIGLAQCETGSGNDYPEATINITELEIEIVDEKITYVRFKSPDRLNWTFLGKKLYSWSPRYKVDTALILDDIVHRNPFGMVESGVELKGFAPYFHGKHWADFGHYLYFNLNFFSSFLNDVIAGKLPVDEADNKGFEWHWVLLNCWAK